MYFGSDMYRIAYSTILLLAFFILSHARTIFISRDGTKTYLPSPSETDVCMTPTCVIAAANVLTSLDQTVDPCDDFYSFSCGGWLRQNEIPEDEGEIHIRISTRNELFKQLRDLLQTEHESSDPPFVTNMKNFYNNCADVDTLEKQGSEPLKTILRRLGGWPVVEGSQWDESTFDWVDTLISFRKLGFDFTILFSFLPKYRNPNILILSDPSMGRIRSANLSQGLDDSIIAAYYRNMVKAAKLLGVEESTAEKELLEALSFQIALINITKSEDDAEEKNNTIAELQRELPHVPWMKVINGLLLNYEVDENQTISITLPDFLVKFADLITSTEKRVIANYMLWRAVLESKDYLSQEWKTVKENEEDEELWKNSPTCRRPRWKKCIWDITDIMEIGLASYYVRSNFVDESKDEAVMMMKYIHKEFLKILEETDWMDLKTKEKAKEKANAIKTFIGYPKELLNDTFMRNVYENLTITPDSYLESILSYRRWKMDKHFAKFNQPPIDPSRIHSPKYRRLLYVGAFYNKETNSMAIPAGILHEAFYDKNRPKYMNFPAIGHIIGHEITHGFDNNGRRFDKDGEEVNWWDKESDERFRKKVKCFIDQYDNYTTDIGLKVNGEKTQNENIADNGGMKEAYLAYQSWTKDNGIEPLLPGVNYTQNQLFWISAALAHCTKYQPEELTEKILLSSHTPAKFRIIGMISNSPEFSRDFKCSTDAPMNRKFKCKVW